MKDLIQSQNIHWAGKSFSVPHHTRNLFEKCVEFLDSPLIINLAGARRVGKSILLKQLINLLLTNHHPQQILFFEFSKSSTKQDLQNLLDIFIQEISLSNKYKYIFLDEIQYVQNYEEVIKLIYDQHPQIKFFLTGSVSLDYQKKSKKT